MDKSTLIKTLNTIFCERNQADKRYSEAWLTDADFGGLYHSGKFVLHVKAEHKIPNCFEEIFSVISLLQSQAPHALEQILSVAVYNSDDDMHCYSSVDDVLVYTQADACQ